MGVSGSGKTTIAVPLARRLGWEFRDGDEFHPPANVAKMRSGIPLTDEDRWPWLRAIGEWLGTEVAEGRHGIVACSALRRRYRDILVGGHRDAIRIVFLDGAKTLIAQRLAARRHHFMPASLLDSQFATLERPTPDEHPVIVSIDATPEAIVGAIVAKLGLAGGRSLLT
ncbi:MAG: gluconokinase [Methylobacteriaceae bacterium]|nr:gluconokinase [Methylobacteriaceae bacterium]